MLDFLFGVAVIAVAWYVLDYHTNIPEFLKWIIVLIIIMMMVVI